MKPTALLAVVVLMMTGGCVSPNIVTDRADNKMLRFSAMSYTAPEAVR